MQHNVQSNTTQTSLAVCMHFYYISFSLLFDKSLILYNEILALGFFSTWLSIAFLGSGGYFSVSVRHVRTQDIIIRMLKRSKVIVLLLYRSSTERFCDMQLMSLYRLCRDIVSLISIRSQYLKNVDVTYSYTSLNPQNLRNIIKKVAKISIIQTLMSNLSVKRTVFCYFSHKFRTFMLVVDKILTNYLMIENTLLFHIRNQYPKVNQKPEYQKICSISILTNWLIG